MPPFRGHYQEKEMSVTLEEIKLYLRVDGNSDDDLIETLKDSAEQLCSDILRNDDHDVLYGTKYGKAYINEAVIGVDANGQVVGYVISATSGNGYEGNIKLSIGITPDGTVKGIAFTELNETPGKGSLAAEPGFINQFDNRSVTQFVLNGSGSDGIDAISGATITSTAVVNAVNAGLDFFHSVMQGGN